MSDVTVTAEATAQGVKLPQPYDIHVDNTHAKAIAIHGALHPRTLAPGESVTFEQRGLADGSVAWVEKGKK